MTTTDQPTPALTEAPSTLAQILASLDRIEAAVAEIRQLTAPQPQPPRHRTIQVLGCDLAAGDRIMVAGEPGPTLHAEWPVAPGPGAFDCDDGVRRKFRPDQTYTVQIVECDRCDDGWVYMVGGDRHACPVCGGAAWIRGSQLRSLGRVS